MTEGIETGMLPEGKGPTPFLAGFAQHAAESVRLQRIAQATNGSDQARREARFEALTEATLAGAFAAAAQAASQS